MHGLVSHSQKSISVMIRILNIQEMFNKKEGYLSITYDILIRQNGYLPGAWKKIPCPLHLEYQLNEMYS